MHDVGIIIIGRNEGERLVRCIESVKIESVKTDCPIVYVDSGSTDGSVERAGNMGIMVWHLDQTLPFSAARARNEGFAHLMRKAPHLRFVQFIDGDCIMDREWLGNAVDAFNREGGLAIVCGRIRERFPDRSIYNLLFDLELDTPSGLVDECGGIFLVNTTSFEQVAGFNPHMAAGEEPELCVRLRKAGWKIRRLDAEMASHDAAIYKFSAWWRRSRRGGYAAGLGMSMHGGKPERHRVHQVRSAIFWGCLLPLMAIAGAWPSGGWSLLLLAAYPVQWCRLFTKERRRGRSVRQGRLSATFLLIAKFAELRGILTFIRQWLSGQKGTLIEYKTPANELAATGNK